MEIEKKDCLKIDFSWNEFKKIEKQSHNVRHSQQMQSTGAHKLFILMKNIIHQRGSINSTLNLFKNIESSVCVRAQ